MSALHGWSLKPSLQVVTICGLFALSACNKELPPQPDVKESVDPSQELQQQLQAQPIKAFAATANDGHDIGLLDQYENRFNAVSNELNEELNRLGANGDLSTDMEQQRKRDLIESSLNMLRDLDLKTEQGRYIQGLYYQYWENQLRVYDELQRSGNNELRNPKDTLNNMSDYYTAQAQLKYWRQQTSTAQAASETQS